MSVIFQLLLGEIVYPAILGMGWIIIFILSFGYVRPTKKTFFKYPIVGLVGLYAWLAIPTVIAILIRVLNE